MNDDDLAAIPAIPATSQEKFLMMINERVGTIDERLFELHTMVAGICEFLFVDTLSCYITTSLQQVIDDAFLEKMIDTIEKTSLVKVDEIWIIARPSSSSNAMSNVMYNICLCLKNKVIAKQVAAKMKMHITDEYPGISFVEDWRETSRKIIEHSCKCKLWGTPKVFYARK